MRALLGGLKPTSITFLLFSLLLLEGCTSIAVNGPPEIPAFESNAFISSDESHPTAVVIFDEKSNNVSVNGEALNTLAARLAAHPEHVLNHILKKTYKKGLHPDKAFKELRQLTSNNETPQKQWYAQQLTAYLLTDGFQCAFPLYQRYFQQRYTSPAKKQVPACAKEIPFNTVSTNGKESVVWLNPNRISAIHLLFASSDEGLISKFGHVALRLIICPKDDFSEAACNKNLYEHVVLGYRAHVNEYSISTIKGLMGYYKAHLYANDFMDIYNQYSVQEFRDLYSLPLSLNKIQRTHMLKALAEMHWGFSGEYKFLTKNCASLLQEAFKLSWSSYDNEASFNTTYLRPDKLFSALQKSALSQASVFKDLRLAEENGFYFPSTEAIYRKAFLVVKYSLEKAGITSLESYLEASPAKRHTWIHGHTNFYNKLKQDDHLRGALLLLEGYSIQHYKMKMRAEISRFFEKYSFDTVKKHLLNQLNPKDYAVFSECILKPAAARMQPKQSFNGIPSAHSPLVGNATEDSCDLHSNQPSVSRIHAELSTIDSATWDTINQAIDAWGHSIDNFIKYKHL